MLYSKDLSAKDMRADNQFSDASKGCMQMFSSSIGNGCLPRAGACPLAAVPETPALEPESWRRDLADLQLTIRREVLCAS